jgi:glycosyltransferase involved in cell wall biosynthesis
MAAPPVISVMTIFLNAERFLDEAVQSVLSQTYNGWELLLVDDGSTDRSTGIARDYAERYPEQIRYFEHDAHRNRGTGASRNLALSHARGEYVAFLDSDDVWMPGKLEQQVAILTAHPEVALLFGRSEYWRSWNQSGDLSDTISDPGVPLNAIIEPPALLAAWLEPRGTFTFCLSSVIFKRTTGVRLGGFDDAFTGLFEDFAFLAKFWLEERIFVADACWDRHREHAGSLVWKAGLDAKRWYASFESLLTWLESYLSREGRRESDVWRALQRALWPLRHPVLYRFAGAARSVSRRFGNRRLRGLVK